MTEPRYNAEGLEWIDGEDEDLGSTGCIASWSGGRWIRADNSALHEKLISDLPLELQDDARKGRVALRLPDDATVN